MSSLKRKRNPASLHTTPSKVRRTAPAEPAHARQDELEKHPSDSDGHDEITLATPTKSRSTNVTPKASKINGRGVNGQPNWTADRSAKRKSTQRIIEQEEGSDEDDELGESHLAQRILEVDELEEDKDEPGSSGPETGREEDGSNDHDQTTGARPQPQPQDTPSKRPRGRPKSSQPSKAQAKDKSRQRTPTPPRQLPPHEHYFFQNRPGASKTSSNTLSSTALLTHEQYRDALKDFRDPHQPEIDFLHDMHAQSFSQWLWEMECGFSVGLYGWGSKREVVRRFSEFAVEESGEKCSVVVVNGYADGVGFKDVLSVLASTISSLCDKSGAVEKLPANPSDALAVVLDALSSTSPSSADDASQTAYPGPTRLLLINSLDAAPLRRAPTPTLLSHLARHPRIALLATFNQPNFPLLWDGATRTAYNWAFHDTTTFAPFDAEIPDVVDTVNALLGRSGRRVQGREGVVYVLRSLTGSARRLFALVCAECLGAGEGVGAEAGARDIVNGFGGEDGEEGQGEDEDEDDEDNGERPGRRRTKTMNRTRRTPGIGVVEYRALYRKAVQSLIATSEVQFRQLLKEFFDHEMLVSERGSDGTEMLGLPFRREECEEILGELVVDE